MRTNEQSIATVSTSDSATPRLARVVAKDLRQRILRGDWPPGKQLPTWDDMASEMQVGRTTLAKAVRQLKRDGFVYSSSTRGTYVTERPPHLYRYAMAFRGEPNAQGWLRFWWALANEATAWNQNQPQELVPFFGVNCANDTASHQQLLEDVHADRVGGVIFVGYPPEISQALLEDDGLAKVAIMGDEAPHWTACVHTDRLAFIDRSLHYIVEQGGRQVGVITAGHPQYANYDQAIAEAGLGMNPYDRISAAIQDPDSANHIVQLMLERPADKRPDWLIVTDDHLVESAMAGVLASGLRIGQDIQLLVHCNWPSQTGALPVKRLGFDARDVLRTAVDALERIRAGHSIAQDLPVAPVFDHEVITVSDANRLS